MRRSIALFAALVTLTACTQEPPLLTCPTIVAYTRSDQTRLADELKLHPDLTETPRWLADYIALRDQVRACQKAR